MQRKRQSQRAQLKDADDDSVIDIRWRVENNDADLKQVRHMLEQQRAILLRHTLETCADLVECSQLEWSSVS